jgi:hypothetical protein
MLYSRYHHWFFDKCYIFHVIQYFPVEEEEGSREEREKSRSLFYPILSNIKISGCSNIHRLLCQPKPPETLEGHWEERL